MNGTMKILLVILTAAVVGAGVWFWFNKDKVASVLNSNSSAQTNTTVINTNTNLPQKTGTTTLNEGDHALTNSTVKVGTTMVTLTSWSQLSTFESTDAPKGNVFVIIYFMPVQQAEVLAVNRGLASDAHLVVNKTTYTLTSLKVASTVVTNDRGYVKFIVPTGAVEYQFVVGSGAGAQNVSLKQ